MADFASNPTFVGPLPEGLEEYVDSPTKTPMTADERANGFLPEFPLAAEHLNHELNRISAALRGRIPEAESVQLANWTAAAAALSQDGRGIAWVEALGLFVACGMAGLIATSPDGVSWTEPDSDTANNLNAVASSPAGVVVVVGFSHRVCRSTDGVTWNEVGVHSSVDYLDVIWGPELFIATNGSGGGSIIETSPDGITWTNRTNPAAIELSGLAWSGFTACAVGEDGAVVTSTNGTVWTLRDSDVGDDLTDVAWTGTLFCAVGENGTIITSPDGVTWTPRASGVSALLRSIVWTGNHLIVVGNDDTMLASRDGITWTKVLHSLAAIGEASVAWSGRRCVSVGDDGLVTRSLARLLL